MVKGRLPIKVVTPSTVDWDKPPGGPSPRKLFREVDDTFRGELASQALEVASYFGKAFRRFPSLPAVAVLRLHRDALAKSHRPVSLLKQSGCSIIGSRQLGELLISVRASTLDRLVRNIHSLSSTVALSNLSTITSITPYTVRDALHVNTGSRKRDAPLKVRLFEHDSSSVNAELRSQFETFVHNEFGIGSAVRVASYGKSPIYKLSGIAREDMETVASFMGTRSLDVFPQYRVLRTSSRRLGPATPAMFAPPEAGRTYPVMAIIDSGIDPDSAFLGPWVEARHWSVAPSECNHDHGTFVGALAVHPRQLNNQNPCFPTGSCKLLDVVAFPASGELPEDELLQAIEDALQAHPTIRVWNLSLSSECPCTDHGFSDLAIRLDQLQDDYNVTFVIAAGNYNNMPFRGWPPEDVGDDDRIGAPGDSVRGLTVGSLAHLGSANARVARGEPSPFSRRGPGPAFLPKPELTHFAGNCDANGNCIQVGVVSLDGSGYLVEDIGTSFASPLVASTLANIHENAAEPMSRSLAKALLIHSAVAATSSEDTRSRHYFGFGVPAEADETLSCANSAATLVFEPDIYGTTYFFKSPFPFPDCLRSSDGHAFGEVKMTLVCDPPLDADWGIEYCQANIEVSLGSYDLNKKGERVHKRLIPPDETDYRKLYEREVVKHGFKWSPVKVYRRTLKRVQAKTWRLKVAAQFREGFQGVKHVKPALVVTISDPTGQRPVYDEVVLKAQQLGWIINDLQVKQQIRAATSV